jgi:osmotically-inducible protein OsmY
MKYLLCCAVLFLATIVLAQQQEPPPTTTPPYQTAPTFPEGRQNPRGQMPPDTQAPPAETMSSQRVEGQILEQFKAEPTLSGTNIDAKVDDNSVVLTGNVNTLAQHDLAIQIAQSNAGNRRIVDKIKVKKQT